MVTIFQIENDGLKVFEKLGAGGGHRFPGGKVLIHNLQVIDTIVLRNVDLIQKDKGLTHRGVVVDHITITRAVIDA